MQKTTFLPFAWLAGTVKAIAEGSRVHVPTFLCPTEGPLFPQMRTQHQPTVTFCTPLWYTESTPSYRSAGLRAIAPAHPSLRRPTLDVPDRYLLVQSEDPPG